MIKRCEPSLIEKWLRRRWSQGFILRKLISRIECFTVRERQKKETETKIERDSFSSDAKVKGWRRPRWRSRPSVSTDGLRKVANTLTLTLLVGLSHIEEAERTNERTDERKSVSVASDSASASAVVVAAAAAAVEGCVVDKVAIAWSVVAVRRVCACVCSSVCVCVCVCVCEVLGAMEVVGKGGHLNRFETVK